MGGFTPGSRLPTENELTEEFNVSRHTARKAMDLLVREGYLQKNKVWVLFSKKLSNRKSEMYSLLA